MRSRDTFTRTCRRETRSFYLYLTNQKRNEGGNAAFHRDSFKRGFQNAMALKEYVRRKTWTSSFIVTSWQQVSRRSRNKKANLSQSVKPEILDTRTIVDINGVACIISTSKNLAYDLPAILFIGYRMYCDNGNTKHEFNKASSVYRFNLMSMHM